MNNQEILRTFIAKSKDNLLKNSEIADLLRRNGIKESFIFENFNLGFVDKSVYQGIGNTPKLLEVLKRVGLYKDEKPIFTKHITIPIYDEGRTISNVALCKFDSKNRLTFDLLNENGIFNYNYLKSVKEIIFTKTPIEALLLIQAGYHNTTFVFGHNNKYLEFITNNNIERSILTFDGGAILSYLLENNNKAFDKTLVDFEIVQDLEKFADYLDKLFDKAPKGRTDTNYTLTKIEKGFLFTFPHISYRIIGKFYENSMSLKVNIKAFKDDEVFINTVDLYKNRERQTFVFNTMDKFSFRDHAILESDLTKIVDVIEKHKEKGDSEDESLTLTDTDKDDALKLLNNPDILDEIENDITNLGYARERKNKILAYLIMTSRLMDNPLHAVVTGRSGTGKSQLVEIIESLCPKQDLKSISDISSQALYYVQENELKHKFITIGEKEGSKESEYPLRELISKKSITKTVTIKEQITGLPKTVTIKAEGPIALIETTTSSSINSENLNRCFIISVDESEEQTIAIQENQRLSDTLEGYILKHEMNSIIKRHHNAQALLRSIHVFNPYATSLTFPSASTQTRRDHHKFLKLIKAVCFLRQYQRHIKQHTLDSGEAVEYIECTLDDYKIAFELLIDGILDNSLDDLPRPARELLGIIKDYLKAKSDKEGIPIEKIVFTRKEIRDFSKWTFSQVRNNFQVLKEHEYLQLIPSRNGLAHQYKLLTGYSDSALTSSILTPEALEQKLKNNPNTLDVPVCSGV